MKFCLFNGGRGARAVLRAIQEYFPRAQVSALINTYDDGKSTGELRRFFEIAGPSDVRKVQHLVIPKDRPDYDSLDALFEYRFASNTTLKEFWSIIDHVCLEGVLNATHGKMDLRSIYGWESLRGWLITFSKISKHLIASGKVLDPSDMSLVNCIYAGAILDSRNSVSRAAISISRVLGLFADVLPISDDVSKLVAIREDGRLLPDESSIVEGRASVRIRRLFLLKDWVDGERFKKFSDEDLTELLQKLAVYPDASPRALRVISDAEVIVFCPGTQHSSLYPTYLLNGVGNAIYSNQQALKIFIVNIGADYETPQYAASDIIQGAVRHLNEGFRANLSASDYFDIVLVNLPSNKNDPSYIYLDSENLLALGCKVLISNFESKSQKGAHCHDILGEHLVKILRETWCR